jgi:2,4-diaminopentanoate dehydrogenase
MSERIRTMVVGLGPIGLETARMAQERQGLELVAIADLDPDKQGRDLADLLGLAAPTGLAVERDSLAALERHRPDLAILCTTSFLPDVVDWIEAAARSGIDVLSSAEELLLPDLQHPDLTRRLQKAALQGGATVLGTGVNPGFVLDFLAVVATGICRRVDRLQGIRVVDAGRRRLPLQRKVGAGLSPEEFAQRAATGRMGHIGLRESTALVARALALPHDQVEQTLEPVIAEAEVSTSHLTVRPGQVAGIRNVAVASLDGEPAVTLDLAMYVGAPDQRDEILVEGDPDLRFQVPGGVPGDLATAAILVNSAPQVAAASPGLKNVLELPPPRCVR